MFQEDSYLYTIPGSRINKPGSTPPSARPVLALSDILFDFSLDYLLRTVTRTQ